MSINQALEKLENIIENTASTWVEEEVEKVITILKSIEKVTVEEIKEDYGRGNFDLLIEKLNKRLFGEPK